MRNDELAAIRNFGEKRIREAGRLAWMNFLSGHYQAELKGDQGDLVTQTDLAVEEFLIQGIQSEYPDHCIESEERGQIGSSAATVRWLIDPLDGTNNFAIGLPIFGVAVSVFVDNELRLAFIHICAFDACYVAEKGGGVILNGKPVKNFARMASPQLTLGWAQGYQVQNPAQADALCRSLRASFKRVLELWAPSVCWILAVEGKIDGFIIYDNESEDLYPGLLMAQEAGLDVCGPEGRTLDDLSHPPQLVIACQPQCKDAIVRKIKVTLGL